MECPNPFGLSLSKPLCKCGLPFDRLRANGVLCNARPVAGLKCSQGAPDVKQILFPIVFFLHTLAAAAVLQPGAILPVMNLKDQHEKPLAIERDTKLVFFASEMGGSRLMTKALDTLPPTALKDRNAVYVADISGMPAIFTTIVALPRLQKMPYPVALVRDAREAASLPRKPGTVTVLRVDAGKISAIDFVKDLQQIKGHLK